MRNQVVPTRAQVVPTRAVVALALFAYGLVSWGGVRGDAAQTPPRPNMVVILVDDLRWDEIGCAGHPFVKTPHVDRVGREGARFLNAFATTPLCSPVRASLLTGLYAHGHGIRDNTNRSAQSHQLVTFPRTLQSEGYETAFIGKWHMGNDPTPRPGFDYWVSIKGQGETLNPEIYEDGKLARVRGYITDVFTDRALRFIERDREKPFLLYLSHKAIHPNLTQYDDGSISDPSAAVFIPAERHRNLYADAPVPRRPNVNDSLEGKPSLQRKVDDLPPLGPETGTSDTTVRNRLRMLAAVDEGLGRLLAALEKSGKLDDTVVVFTSDHGYFNGEHGLSVERRLAYEETIRIPLIIRYPRLVKAGSTPDELVLGIDLAPTFVDLARAKPTAPMHGRSLVPLLKGEATDWRTSFLVEYYTDTVFPRVLDMGYKAVRTDRYKYIHYLQLQGMDELYDLESDPYEMKNLIAEQSSWPVLRQMKTELLRLLRDGER
ncbi:MAG TPA: sulfatase [Thermoguttaceae bacterium]|nr:sulfatase [Thermoguttaceae bacterium]